MFKNLFSKKTNATAEPKAQQEIITPETIKNKQFPATKFNQGYSNSEVDDFLYTIVTDLTKLLAENETLKTDPSSSVPKSEIITPEEIINISFQPTKFRDGYDQDSVDDYLDEIILEFRKLNEENTSLRNNN